MDDENSLKRNLDEVPASQDDLIDQMMDDPTTTFFHMIAYLDFDTVRDTLIANGWTVHNIGGVETTFGQKDLFGLETSVPKIRILPYRAGDDHIMAHYQHYDPVFLRRDKRGVMIMGFKQELRPLTDLLKPLEQKKLNEENSKDAR
jgi:hypothetical protein